MIKEILKESLGGDCAKGDVTVIPFTKETKDAENEFAKFKKKFEAETKGLLTLNLLDIEKVDSQDGAYYRYRARLTFKDLAAYDYVSICLSNKFDRNLEKIVSKHFNSYPCVDDSPGGVDVYIPFVIV